MVGIWLLAATLSVVVDNQSIDPLSEPKGTIAIAREKRETIENFQMGGKPFSPKLLHEDDTEALYEFIPPFEKIGLNLVPVISVEVGGEELEFPASSYSLSYEEPKEGLLLRAFIYGEEPFYPGKRLEFVYKVYYRGSIALKVEELPLLHAEGFKKIGELEIEDTTYEGYQVRIIRQRVETEKPGTFSFEKSVMKGVLDNREEVMTVVEPFKIEVLPFPEENIPLTFTGATGEWEIQTKLLSESKVRVGEKLLLEVTLTGSGQLQNLSLPPLFCLPGFRGFFSPTGNPVVAKEGSGEKKFYVELVPTTAMIDAIPPVEFTSFNQGKYLSIGSTPIPLTIVGGKEIPPFPDYTFSPSDVDWKRVVTRERVEIGAKNTWWWIWFLPLLLPLEYILKQVWERRKRERKRIVALRKAEKYGIEDLPFLKYLREALEGISGDEVFSLVDRVKYGGERIPKEAIMEKAWESIS